MLDILSIIQSVIYALKTYETLRSIQSAPTDFSDMLKDAESVVRDLNIYESIFEQSAYPSTKVKRTIEKLLSSADELSKILHRKLEKWKDRLERGPTPSSPDEDDDDEAALAALEGKMEATTLGEHLSSLGG